MGMAWARKDIEGNPHKPCKRVAGPDKNVVVSRISSTSDNTRMKSFTPFPNSSPMMSGSEAPPLRIESIPDR